MRIAVGSDHGGFNLKKEIIAYLKEKGHSPEDFGTFNCDSCDYPDVAVKVAREVSQGNFERGVLLCGTGIGIGIVANKVPGIRAALCHDTYSARATREHNDSNILTMGERVIGPGLALDILKIWLETNFTGGRHQCRVDKIKNIEEELGNKGR
ncbi:MAG: ribose 5-phosphate isomerase B [Clostridia bacterium]|jgi:ribose 5-phosphate isomerase B|nr:ribose 5-phosphate isomerase B [Clostridia bacterium]